MEKLRIDSINIVFLTCSIILYNRDLLSYLNQITKKTNVSEILH